MNCEVKALRNQRETADIILHHGRVLTVDAKDSIEEAVAIQGKHILAVGKNQDILALAGENTQLIDAVGRTVMPGFIDAHLHYGMYGLLDHGVINLTYPRVKSIREIQELIRQAAAGRPTGEWIKLNGYDHNKIEEGRHPTRQELDEAAPDHPVQCTRICGHMGVYNTVGLRSAGIHSSEGYAEGEVELNPDGSLHGLLRDTAHMVASRKVIFPREELLEGFRSADRILAECGITSAHDAGTYGAQATSVMQDACNDGLIRTRLYPMIFDIYGKDSAKEYLECFLRTGVHTGCGGEHFRLGPAKIMLDGSSSGPSCAVIEGYTHDPQNHGIRVWEQEEADQVILAAHRAGFQVTAHAVGDYAVTIIVNAIERAMQAYPRKDCRHRIEHCGITNLKLIHRIAKLGIVPISNPSFITINGSDYNRYYGSRTDYLFAMRSYLDHGICTAIGSDAPITPPDPMSAFFAALNRKDGKTLEDVGPGQQITALEMVRMFTYNGAYASFEEDIKGSLEPGKLADVVLLSEDILRYPAERIWDVKVLYTISDGRIIYQRS